MESVGHLTVDEQRETKGAESDDGHQDKEIEEIEEAYLTCLSRQHTVDSEGVAAASKSQWCEIEDVGDYEPHQSKG